MKLGGTANKLLGIVDKNASLLGTGALLLERSTGLQESIGRIFGGSLHAPEINNLLQDMYRNPKYPMAVMAIIGAEVAKGSGIGIVNKLAGIIGKAATAYLVAGIAENVLYYSTHSPEPFSGGGNSAGYGY